MQPSTRALCTVLAVSLLAQSACRRQSSTSSGTTPRAAPGTERVPESLAMGGAKSRMTFFVTGVGLGNGGDLGGLAGADAHCQALATAEGSGDHTWRAYLSAAATPTGPAVNARDRIGRGPWYNAEAELVAANVGALHGSGNRLSAETALTQKGDSAGRDVLTGSTPEGTAFDARDDRTCGNWTSTIDRHAQVGHADRQSDEHGGGSWNSSHLSSGCRPQDLSREGGGRFYCFGID